MRNSDDSELGGDFTGDLDEGTIFRDIIMLALLGFVMIVVLLLPHLNPPAARESDVPAAGNLIVEARWPDGLNVDVDLWVRAPGDDPVGYSAQSGRIFNLLRDDLGHRDDVSGLNYEVAFARGVPAGDYAVNLHLYRVNEERVPIPVQVSIRRQPMGGTGISDGQPRLIDERTVSLTAPGQEMTIARFTLDEDGALVPGSLHDTPVSLRAAHPNDFSPGTGRQNRDSYRGASP